MKAIAASVVGVMVGAILATAVVRSQSSSLAARVESLAAFDERSIPASGVAPPSNTPGIATPPRKPRAAGAPVLSRRALPAGGAPNAAGALDSPPFVKRLRQW